MALRVGDELGPSSWLEVGQETIDVFAACTHDGRRIHVDRELAAAGPFGMTIAHGFLTLSLCVPLLYGVAPLGPESGFLPVWVADLVPLVPLADEEAG
ncbi:MAG TPA: MaoC/PaaZ C-terminal domain-containing protein [Gaiella sp.]|nr:MaoC/PaaZ C-terminal domain-containing protein [Gaiella sp.]